MRIYWLVVLAIVFLAKHGEGGKGKKCKRKMQVLSDQISDLNKRLEQCNDDHEKKLAECGDYREKLARCNDTLKNLVQSHDDLGKLAQRCSEDREKLAQRNRELENMQLLDVFIRSEGCNDPGKFGCGLAYIEVNGTEYSPQSRGHNVVVVDGQSGEVLESKAFDTHGAWGDGKKLKEYLDSLAGDKWVLVAVQDESSYHEGPAFPSLVRLGGHEPFARDYRHSYALVGYAGSGRKRDWVIQEQRKAGKGPSIIRTKVLLG